MPERNARALAGLEDNALWIELTLDPFLCFVYSMDVFGQNRGVAQKCVFLWIKEPDTVFADGREFAVADDAADCFSKWEWAAGTDSDYGAIVFLNGELIPFTDFPETGEVHGLGGFGAEAAVYVADYSIKFGHGFVAIEWDGVMHHKGTEGEEG